MSDNTQIPSVSPPGGDTIRTLDKSGNKTQVVALDLGGAGAESLLTGALPVSVGNFPATQPVSIAGSVAVTGTFFPAAGQNTSANSQSVVIANDQIVATSQAPVTASGSITTQNLVPAGTATAGSAVEITLNGASTLAIQTTGTYTGALTLQATLNGTTWVSIATGSPLLNVNTGAYLATITSALQSIFTADVGAYQKARITALAAVTGTATVNLLAVPGASMMALDAAIPAGTNSIGNIGTVTTVTGATLAAGTNLAADVGLGIRASATGALTAARVVSSTTVNNTLVLTGARRLYKVTLFNTTASAKYFKLYNKATAPAAGTDTPVNTMVIPANGGVDIDYLHGRSFSLGLCYAITGALADSDTTVTAAADVTGECLYA